MAEHLQVPSEILVPIYGQVYTRHEFRSLAPSKVMNAVQTTCTMGSSYGAGYYVSVAKSIWGEAKINTWLTEEAPSENPRRR